MSVLWYYFKNKKNDMVHPTSCEWKNYPIDYDFWHAGFDDLQWAHTLKEETCSN